MIKDHLNQIKTSRELSDCTHTHRVFYGKKEKQKFVCRSYSRFAEYGSLSTLLYSYIQVSGDEKGSKIPEPVVWLVFYSIAGAIHAMNTTYCATKEATEVEALKHTIDTLKSNPTTVKDARKNGARTQEADRKLRKLKDRGY